MQKHLVRSFYGVKLIEFFKEGKKSFLFVCDKA